MLNVCDLLISCTTQCKLMFQQGHYVCLAQFMDLGPIADVYIDITGSDIYFEALLDTHQCKFKAEVLKVTKLG